MQYTSRYVCYLLQWFHQEIRCCSDVLWQNWKPVKNLFFIFNAVDSLPQWSYSKLPPIHHYVLLLNQNNNALYHIFSKCLKKLIDLWILKITVYTKYCIFSVRNIRFQKSKILQKAKSMLNVNICGILQLAITFITKIIHVTRYQSFVDTLYDVILYSHLFDFRIAWVRCVGQTTHGQP